MNFDLPEALERYLFALDRFIDEEIKPLEQANDNIRFFDHRREWARTDFDRGGLPRHEWGALLGEMRRRAHKAGPYRFALPKENGREDGCHPPLPIVPEQPAPNGLRLHHDPPHQRSIAR